MHPPTGSSGCTSRIALRDVPPEVASSYSHLILIYSPVSNGPVAGSAQDISSDSLTHAATDATLENLLEVVERAQSDLQDLDVRLHELRELVRDAQEFLAAERAQGDAPRPGEPAAEPVPTTAPPAGASAGGQRRRGRCYVVVRHPDETRLGLYQRYPDYCVAVSDPSVTWSGRGGIPSCKDPTAGLSGALRRARPSSVRRPARIRSLANHDRWGRIPAGVLHGATVATHAACGTARHGGARAPGQGAGRDWLLCCPPLVPHPRTPQNRATANIRHELVRINRASIQLSGYLTDQRWEEVASCDYVALVQRWRDFERIARQYAVLVVSP